MVAKHATILMDDELIRKIRKHQARMMLERNAAYSFSDAVNDLLARGLATCTKRDSGGSECQ